MIRGIANWINTRARQLNLLWPMALEIAIAGVAVWAHVWKLSSMPQGIYKDEVSFAYNAHLIATTGRDEHGVWFPMYPEAFGEYKSAGYAYLSVLVMRVCGLWSWTVRAPSVICWLAGSGLLYALGRRLWPSLEARVFLLLQLAFTPSLLCLSRVAFEAIGLYPALALFLLGVQRGFEEKDPRWAAIAGVAISASTYVYATFRLLAPLHCLLILLCYGSRQHWRSLVSFATSSFITAIPFAWYMYAHGERLTWRYQHLVGYIHRPMPLTEKLSMFFGRYVHYFSPEYLLTRGDQNLRHHTGFCGELFAPSVLALLLGLGLSVFAPRFRRIRFNHVLLGGMVLSPIAASLALDGGHSMRAFSLVVFAIAIALAQIGFHHVLCRAPRAVPAFIVVATVLCSTGFTYDYFGRYQATTVGAFEYYGLEQAIVKAVRAQPSRVLLDSRQASRHADLYLNFYKVILSKRWRGPLPPMQPGKPRAVQPGDYFVFTDRKHAFPELRDGLPPDTLYVAAPHGPVTKQLRKRIRRVEH